MGAEYLINAINVIFVMLPIHICYRMASMNKMD